MGRVELPLSAWKARNPLGYTRSKMKPQIVKEQSGELVFGFLGEGCPYLSSEPGAVPGPHNLQNLDFHT
jgi:hypothetical protein